MAKWDEYGLLPTERVAVEDYLVDRAEKALDRVDAGEYYTHEETKQLFANKIEKYRREKQ